MGALTASVHRVHLVFLGVLLYLLALGLSAWTLPKEAPPPRPIPPPSSPRGNLYAHEGTPLAVSLGDRRFYPLSPSASQLLGFGERKGGRGLEGLERDLERALAQGKSFTLTLDPWIQALSEMALWKGLRESRGEFGSALVLDREGRLLAVANGPPFDPEAPREDPTRHIAWRNHAFLVPLEPGSTMKALTAAILLEEGAADLKTPVQASMARRIGGWTIRDSLPHPPTLTLAEVLRYSSNVGISLLGERIPQATFYRYMEALHLTDPNPLPGVRVAAPLVPPLGAWSRAGYANHTFGQGFLVTPLHLAAAYGTLIEGLYHPPRLFQGEAPRPERVFSPKTAQAIRQALTEGLAPRAVLPGYPLAGKTGTAQVVVKGRYSSEVHTAWFAGFVPGDRPLYTVVVAVYYPKTAIHGSLVAAPIFREIAAGLLAYRGLPPYAGRR